MKKIIFTLVIVLAIHCTFNIDNCSAQWVQMSNGIGNIVVASLAFSGNYLFAGTSGYGVYYSTNDGSSWIQTVSGIPSNHAVYSIAVNGNYIFAGTGPGNGIYLSTNNGINWSQTSLNDRHVWSLAVNGNTIFAGTQVWGVYKSIDNGTSWTQTQLNNKSINALATKGDTIYAGIVGSGTNQGVYLSTDNGTSWVQTSFNNSTVLSLGVNGNTVYAGTYLNGLYQSTNSGMNWTQTSLNGSIDALEFNGNTIFATVRNSGVYVSITGGISWTLWNEGLGNRIMEDFCIFNNYIFLGTNYSVWRRPLSELTGIELISNEVPQELSLSQNYPNPFNPKTIINYSISVDSRFRGNDRVVLMVFDATGKEVAVLVNEEQRPGVYEVEFDGSNLSSGIYFYKLQTGEFSEVKRMVLIR